MGEEKYPDIIELKLKLHFSAKDSQIRQNMENNFETSQEVMERILAGKSVEGSLHYDASTGKIVIKAYNRQPRKRERDRLVIELENGWLKESAERLKFYCSEKKALDVPRILEAMERSIRTALAAYATDKLLEHYPTDKEIVDRV